MSNDANHSAAPDNKLAAVCGLYCESCTLYIATRDDPQRLTHLANRFQLTEEEMTCYGCRSDKRSPYCEQCKIFSCAAERGIDFCGDCTEYPCDELKQFQAERPHRIELFDDLKQIKAVGCQRWLKEIRGNYTCPECQCINSAYDLKCRKCGNEPSCNFVAKYKETIEQCLKNM